MGHLVPDDVPVASKHTPEVYPDEVPGARTDKGQDQDLQPLEFRYASCQRYDGSNTGKESVEEHQEIAIFPVLFLSSDDLLRTEEPVISLNKETPSQKDACPEESHKAAEAPYGRGHEDSHEIQSIGSDQKSAEGRNGIPRYGRKDILHKGAQAQHNINKVIGQRIKEVE